MLDVVYILQVIIQIRAGQRPGKGDASTTKRLCCLGLYMQKVPVRGEEKCLDSMSIRIVLRGTAFDASKWS